MLYPHKNKLIVSEARSWLNTPFILQGRIKGSGIDCLGFVLEVASKFGIKIPKYDINYDIYDNQNLLETEFSRIFTKLETVEIGSIVVLRKGGYSHTGIVGDYMEHSKSLIHACMQTGKVVEHRLLPSMRPIAIFKI